MKEPIVIKGNKSGLTIHMDDIVEFPLIQEALNKKLLDSRKFFGNSKVTIEFVGRELNDLEEDELIRTIQSASDLDIICIVDEKRQYIQPQVNSVAPASEPVKDLQKVGQDIKKEEDPLDPDLNTLFHKGTLRSGQELVSESSIIIMGNVHNGASVTSGGNVIVIGKLSGSVYAGKPYNQNAFVVSLVMSPTQIRIADIFGRPSDKKGKKLVQVPQIAFVEDDRIVIENISRNTYDQISNMNN